MSHDAPISRTRIPRPLALWLLAASSLALSLAVLGVLGELILRMQVEGGVHYELYRVAKFDRELGWSLIPGDYEFFHPAAFTHSTISIDEIGLRGRDIRLKPPSGTERVTVVGDSFVFAAALPEEARLTGRMATQLEGTEVVNVSVPGFGTGQQKLLVERLVAQGYDPGRTIVHLFFLNDILDNAGRKYGREVDDPTRPAWAITPDGLKRVREPIDPTNGRPRAFYTPSLLERSLFFGVLKKRAFVAASNLAGLAGFATKLGVRVPLPRTPGIINGWYRDGWTEMWETTEALLAEFKVTAHAAGAERFVVVFLPSPFQVEPVLTEVIRGHEDDEAFAAFLEDKNRPQRVFFESCERHGIECHDLTPKLLRDVVGEPAYFLREGHLNEHGSLIVGRELARLIEAR